MITARQIWNLLLPDQRRAAAALITLMLFGMVLETLGIGIVIPLLTFMSQENPVAKYPELRPYLARLGEPTHAQILVMTMLVLVAIYAVKTFFLALLAWRQARFAFNLQESLSQRLFAGYLRQPYTFHLQRNSAHLIQIVTNEANLFAQTIMAPGMTLLSEALVLVGVGALLLAIEPVGALLVIATLSVVGFMFHHFTRARLLRWGKTRQFHEGMRIQHLQQGLGGAKDVKLLGREADFLAQYAIHNAGIARVGERQATLKALPRLWLEFLAVIGLAALVLSMLAQGKPLDALIPTLGVFAAAAFRLMPSVNKVLTSAQSLRYSIPVTNKLTAEFALFGAAKIPQQSGPLPYSQVLQARKVSYTYPGGTTMALSDVNLSIPRGASVGFVGGSGAGKSTLIDVVLGLLPPTQGAVYVDDVDIQTNLRGWQSQIGYVPQTIFLTDDTLRRNIAFGLPNENIDDVSVWRAVRSAQLEHFVHELPEGLDTVVGERGVRLSGGQRQRIGIARALYHDPSVLVLDEATSSLDTATEQGVMEAVRALQGQKTILIVAHRVSTVADCDRLYQLDKGKLVEEGGVVEMLKDGVC